MAYTKKKTTQKPVKDNTQGLKDCRAQFEADEKACDAAYPDPNKPPGGQGNCHSAANDAHKNCQRGALGAPPGTTKA
jgi:hypothetical protein